MSTRGRVVGPDDEPVSGRSVSNGLEVAITDSFGEFVLAESDQPFVWVHRGAGLDCDEWYRSVGEPSGDEEKGPIIFRLTVAPTRRRIGHITDLHVDVSSGAFGLAEGDTTSDKLAAVLAELRFEHGCDLVLATGDLTNRGAVADFAGLRSALEGSPLPVFYMPGNHDHYGDYFASRDGSGQEGGSNSDEADRSERTQTLGSGWRYEQELGPRWWSMTECGLRIVAIDWYTWEAGTDDEVQREWLAADLAMAESGTPVLVLSHDLMPRSFFEDLARAAPHVRIIGSLSGHWHTARSARVDGEVHLNTGNPMFGSWDWSPPHVRLLSWQDDELKVETRRLGVGKEHRQTTFSPSAVTGDAKPGHLVRWRSTLPGVAHLGGPTIIDRDQEPSSIVVGWRNEDSLAGGVTSVSNLDGTAEWTVYLGGGVLAPVAVRDQDVVAVTIDGQVASIESRTGSVRWTAAMADRRGLWVCSAPLIADDVVVVGSGPVFAGFAMADGRELWNRSDLGSHEMYPSYGDGLVSDNVVILGLPSAEPSIVALNPRTGETIWQAGGPGRSSPAGSLIWGEHERFYGLSQGTELFCFDSASGEELFRVPLEGHYTWAAPAATPQGVVVVTGDARVHACDPIDGSPSWQMELPAGHTLGFAPYKGLGRSSITSPIVTEQQRDAPHCLVATTDGGVWKIEVLTGEVRRLVLLPAPITSGIGLCSDSVIVPTSNGSLWSLALENVGTSRNRNAM